MEMGAMSLPEPPPGGGLELVSPSLTGGSVAKERSCRLNVRAKDHGRPQHPLKPYLVHRTAGRQSARVRARANGRVQKAFRSPLPDRLACAAPMINGAAIFSSSGSQEKHK